MISKSNISHLVSGFIHLRTDRIEKKQQRRKKRETREKPHTQRRPETERTEMGSRIDGSPLKALE